MTLHDTDPSPGDPMRVTFHGVRGSTPCNGPEVARYGGNTSCVVLDIPGVDPILFDLGTGLRYFGLSRPEGPFSGTCLLSHLHWDHIQGLPFFTPLLRPGSHVHVHGPRQADGRGVGDVFASTIRPPLFPVSLDMLPGDLSFIDVADDSFTIDPAGEVQVMSRLVPHVGPTLGFRVTWRGRSVVYLSDHQMPVDGSFAATDGALELCDGADLVIHDAQFTPMEFARKADWGHCTIDYAVWLAQEAGAKNLALFHHDPSRDDDQLDAIARFAGECGQRYGVNVFAARETAHVDI